MSSLQEKLDFGMLAPLALLVGMGLAAYGCGNDNMTYKHLSAEERRVIEHKGTEPAGVGLFVHYFEDGAYNCKRCGAQLYNSDHKFESGCGWPAFDDEVEGAVERVPDPDGVRTEIVCVVCGAHLGHVFQGEGLTPKNVRHCVNSISLDFNEDDRAVEREETTETAVFASGCFWGTEYFMAKAEGVLGTTVGYIGGDVEAPSYEQVCTGLTGHAEAVEVVFDTSITSYETLARLFFETHDPTQVGRQGPDVGSQYRSAIFFNSPGQEEVARRLVDELEAKGLRVATQVVAADKFWPAEEYHQNYYDRKDKQPYCHAYVRRF